jgi:hypothetical protein
MDADERSVYYYVKSQRPRSVPCLEICRHVGGKRRFRYDPSWAQPVLLRLADRGILQNDAAGNYQLKPMPRREVQGRHWVSPAIAEILKASGKEFSNVLVVEDEDEYYDNL